MAPGTNNTSCGTSCLSLFCFEDEKSVDVATRKGGKTINDAHPCMDLDSRTVLAGEVDLGEGSDLIVRYAYICQKGYHPSKLNWICQDDCQVIEGYRGKDEQVLIGVYDGHGIVGEGDLAAKKAKSYLPIRLGEAMDSTGGKVKASFEKAFQTTSDQMVKELLNESGSTAVAALFQGKNLHISNCGDTRAILGQQAEGAHRLVPVELSSDHKAFRADERMRILRDHPNTEVLTFGMKDGRVPISDEFGSPEDPDVSADPPRIWVKGETYPGCSYTRSLGDAAAKKSGVLARPEVSFHKLTPTDKYMVLCTDGLTEFLTNEDIMGFCKKNDKPVDTCEELVQTAFNWFIDDDGWTDDITVCVCYFDWK